MLYLICYDVVSDKRRNKLAKLLLDLGDRIQRSAFECRIADPDILGRFLRRAQRLLDPQTDSLRCYRVCAACREEIIRFGETGPTPPGEALVI